MFGMKRTDNFLCIGANGLYIKISEGHICIPAQSHACITCFTMLPKLTILQSENEDFSKIETLLVLTCITFMLVCVRIIQCFLDMSVNLLLASLTQTFSYLIIIQG
jgi:hypothetical protein